MKLLNIRGRRATKSAIAWSLLAGVFVLTSTPVCGSVLDVDSAACCRRHACVLPPSTNSNSMHDEQSGQSPMSCCSSMEVKTDSRSNNDLCCHVGGLIYPTAKAQAAVSFASVLNTVAVIQSPAIAVLDGERREVSPDPYLKIPIRSLYTLTANYRI
jgi:hypothetical protein